MVSLKAEVLSSYSGFSFTNTLISTLLVDAVIVLLLFFLNRQLSLRPGRLQNIIESVVEYFYDFAKQVAGVRADNIFPWFFSFFLFILVSNVMGLLPGFGTLQFVDRAHGHVPLFRAATSDLNTTLALAAVSLAATHIMSLRYIGLKDYLLRFFSLNPIFLFVGMLEMVSEATKLVSLSFRLFGNILSGEVVLSTISGLGSFTAFLVPLPFLVMESLVALIQALVFAMLTMVFMSMMTTPHSSH